jgi:putative FmdB family regulatory protein
MPTYNYACDECGHEWELEQRITDAATTVCPEGHKKARRMISNTSFSLKGGGWYSDGYGAPKGRGE